MLSASERRIVAANAAVNVARILYDAPRERRIVRRIVIDIPWWVLILCVIVTWAIVK